MRHPIIRRLLSFLLALLLLLSAVPAMAKEDIIRLLASDYPVTEDGWYSTMEEVAVYLATFDELPDNFLTKKEAEKKGWNNRKGNLDDVAPGCSIGGDRFGNYEGLLPEDREYTECDIDTLGKDSRGAKRIVFSDDGLIYYTEDHYESFELLYGEP